MSKDISDKPDKRKGLTLLPGPHKIMNTYMVITIA